MATALADKPTELIAALLQERQRYEQWLAALESRRATTPPHVYARVHTDYEARLSRVLEELGGRSAELRQVVDALTERVTSLQSEENEHRDQRAEAELRAAVGEYTPEQWREVSQTSEADIARVAARRAEAASELAQVQQLLNMATTAGPRRADAPGSQGPRAEPRSDGRDARSGDPRVAPRPDKPVDRKPAESGGFDELAFLHSVVEHKPDAGAAARVAPEGAGRAGSAPTQGASATTQGPSSAQPSSAAAGRAKTPAAPPQQVGTAVAQGARTAAAAGPGPAGASGSPAGAAPAGQPVATSRSVMTPPEASLLTNLIVPEGPPEPGRRVPTDSGGVPAFLRDVPSEQIKTLKCAECGNMNYPTEWYCERCGGELAAM